MSKKVFKYISILFLLIFFISCASTNVVESPYKWISFDAMKAKSPLPRISHSLASLGNGRAILFGGLIYERKMNKYLVIGDTWIYEQESNNWTNHTIKEKDMDAMSVSSSVMAANPPHRIASAMSYIGDNKAILFGGYGQELLSDTWIFNGEKNIWTNVSVLTEKTPTKRAYHTMAYLGDGKVLLFGGVTGSNAGTFIGDTWIYDINTNKWEEYKQSSKTPAVRREHAMAYLGNGMAILYGGGNMDGARDDTWIFDINNNGWTELKISGTQPSVRVGHDMANLSEGKVILFGGYYRRKASDKLYFPSKYVWEFNLETKQWIRYLYNGNKPQGRKGNRLAPLEENKVILFGGGRTNNDNKWDFLTDTWELLPLSE
jgi:N-acetylneuraminic acid mutarotase